MTERGGKAQPASELLQIKGVGKVLAQRLLDAGLDSFARIAEAGEEGLKNVRGIPPRAIGPIVVRARQLSRNQPAGQEQREESLKNRVADLRDKVQSVAQSARERYQEQLGGRRGKKLSADMVRIEDALGQLGDGGGQKRYKRAVKALTKADKRVSGLDEASLKKIRKRVKRARKVVLKAL
jgi:ribosomal protein S13